MNQLILLGISHKTAPVEWRERFAVADDQLAALLKSVTSSGALAEAVALSTCNRVEIYGATADPNKAQNALLSRIVETTGAAAPPTSFYFHSDENALQHIFRVAAGLDSLVIGESEILGQVKRAYENARQLGFTGKLTNVIFQRALFLGKRIRSESGFSWGALSVPGLAVSLAQRIFGDLKKSHVLLVGAGEMAESAAEHFVSQKVAKLVVVNRTQDKAEDIARRCGGASTPIEDLAAQIVAADIALFSTSAPEPLLTKERLAELMVERRHRSLFLIDIGVPRNVSPDCHQLENVYLYNVDDLTSLAAENAARQTKAVQEAETVLGIHVREFLNWYTAWQKGEISALKHAAESASALSSQS